MEDFAGILLAARERAQLTQAQVAASADLTPSYLSFIENRKKPPPSDDVCRRLAAVLDIPARSLIEVAHMERAPATVQERVRTLSHTLRSERRSRKRVLEALLSPFLFAGPAGLLESALSALAIKPTRRRRLREVLAAVGRRHHDRADKVGRIVDELPERDRKLLLEALPRLLGEGAGRGNGPTRSTTAGAGSPPLLYTAPDREAMPVTPYLLAVDESSCCPALAELRPGDRLLVDPRADPAPGDLVVLRGAGSALVRRLEETPGGFRLAGAGGSDDSDSGILDQALLEQRLADFGAGTVVEIRRPLRRDRRP